MVHFVGAGCGAADLITVRGAKLLSEADVVIYAGSLVNPELLNYCKEGCEIHNSAKMTLEETTAVIVKAEAEGKTTVRLHTGDSSIYGAVREQFDELIPRGIEYDVTPGVSAFCGAAASLTISLKALVESTVIQDAASFAVKDGVAPICRACSVIALKSFFIGGHTPKRYELVAYTFASLIVQYSLTNPLNDVTTYSTNLKNVGIASLLRNAPFFSNHNGLEK